VYYIFLLCLFVYLSAVVGDEFQEQGNNELAHRRIRVSVCQKLSIVHETTDILHQLQMERKKTVNC